MTKDKEIELIDLGMAIARLSAAREENLDSDNHILYMEELKDTIRGIAKNYLDSIFIKDMLIEMRID